jgi:GTPase SAR1 family protein
MGSICIKPQPPKVIENLDSKGGSVIDKDKYIIAPKNDEEKKIDVKILLLGAGETGKSTVMKQLRIFVQGGFTTKELIDYKPLIFDQVVNCMKVLINACKDFGIELHPANKETGANFFISFEVNDPPNPELSKSISAQTWNDLETLWADLGIQKAYGRRSELKLDDSTRYWFENLDRLRAIDYVPNEADILRSRVRSFGVAEFTSVYDGKTVQIIDVGGQKSERKKWVQCFEGVNTVIYVVSLGDYDLKLREDDEASNRMLDSLNVFENLCKTPFFKTSNILLFLNKVDLLAEKIQRVDLSTCFPDYTGGKDFERSQKFIKDKFLHINKNCLVKMTTATNTNNMKQVFNSCKDALFNKINLNDTNNNPAV